MRGLRHPYLWGRQHPWVVDGVIAAAVVAGGVVSELAPGDRVEPFREADAFSIVVTLLGTLPVLFRRRFPVPVYGLALAATVAHGAGDYSGAGPWLAMLFGLYAVAAYSRRSWSIGCLVSALVLSVVSIFAAPHSLEVAEIVAGFVVPVAAWLLGDNLRVRRAYVGAVEDRATHLERERDARARQAVLEERARIARELHDIVAHGMSVMVVQAGAARRTLDRDPEAAAEAIGRIEETGRGALAEMRRVVGVLRGDDRDRGARAAPADDGRTEAAGLAGDGASDRERLLPVEPEDRLGPQPDISRIPALVERCREAGLEVSYRVEGAERPLPSGLQLVVYRVVQEALTNTMKHAGPAVRANVTLTYGKRVLSVLVVDDGRGAAALQRPDDGMRSGQHGLGGMIERVALYNGEMKWGPRRGGGFRVAVRLPLLQASLGDV